MICAVVLFWCILGFKICSCVCVCMWSRSDPVPAASLPVAGRGHHRGQPRAVGSSAAVLWPSAPTWRNYRMGQFALGGQPVVSLCLMLTRPPFDLWFLPFLLKAETGTWVTQSCWRTRPHLRHSRALNGMNMCSLKRNGMFHMLLEFIIQRFLFIPPRLFRNRENWRSESVRWLHNKEHINIWSRPLQTNSEVLGNAHDVSVS